MISRSRLSTIFTRTAALTFFASVATLGLNAQQSAVSLPALSLKASLIAPLDLATPSDLSYSSSTGANETAAAESYNFGETTQPPPRRRYGRPNYSDSHTNPDGSNKYAFQVGGGFGIPVGGAHNYLTTGWGFEAGVGRNFNKRLGVMAQFDYDHFGFQNSTLVNQLNIYNGPFFEYGLPQLGGNSTIWSFTLNPRYTFYESDNYGAYVVAGVGFYHKTANFTVPTIVSDGFFEFQANQTVDRYTSNAPGFSAGFGLTYKFSRFASQRLFMEARYVFIDNSPRPFDYGDANFDHVNVFPQNSARTSYIPVKFGIRF
jgi:hypothetical protein